MVEVWGGGWCIRVTLPSALLPLGCRTYAFIRTVAGKTVRLCGMRGPVLPWKVLHTQQQGSHLCCTCLPAPMADACPWEPGPVSQGGSPWLGFVVESL